MKKEGIRQEAWPMLGKLQKKEMETLLSGYMDYTDTFKYLRYLIIAFMAVVLGYNLFVAGRRFPLSELNTIQTVMASFCGLIVIGLVVLLVIVLGRLGKLKGVVNGVADHHRLDQKSFRKEFHDFVKTTIGGPGIK